MRVRYCLAAILFIACDLPRDPSDTLERVQHGTMRVGFVVDTPWVTDSIGIAGGVEAALVQTLARDVNAHVRWIRGTESSLLQALERREIDLVIGGFTSTSPWKKQLAMTRPYYTDTILVAGPPGQPPPSRIAGQTIAVRPGDPIATEIRSKSGTPVEADDLQASPNAIATSKWRIDRFGRVPNTRLILMQSKHVLAASPGENAWLERIEQMLHAQGGRVPSMLRSTPR